MKKTDSASIKHLFLFLFLMLASSLSLADIKAMKQLIVEQRFQEAYDRGSQLLIEEAGNPEFDMLYGVAALRVEEFDQALFAFERVLMFNKNAPVPRFELARTHYILGNLIAARHHFNLVLESQPKPPLVIQRRIQWYLATIDAKEAGKALATSGAVNRFYIGARFGHDSNPRNLTDQEVLWFGRPLTGLPEVASDTYHKISLGANHLQQQTARWGWFVSGNADLKGYHSIQKNMDNYSLGFQGGGILLGNNWRLAMPLQVNKQVREDNNEVLVLAMSANFNQRLSSKADYSVFGQLADVDTESKSSTVAINSYTLGANYSYRFNDSLKLDAGPILATENPKSRTGEHYGRNLLGLRTAMSYSFSDEQRLDFNFNYLNATHKADDPSFLGERRKDNQVNYELKFSQRYPNDILADFGIQRINNSSSLSLYSYRRTQVSVGIRKEW